MNNNQDFCTDFDKKEMLSPVDTQESVKRISREQMLADTDKLLADFAEDYKEMAR